MKAQKLYLVLILIVLCGFASHSSCADIIRKQPIFNVAQSVVSQNNTHDVACVIGADISEVVSSRGATETRSIQKNMSGYVGYNTLFRSDIQNHYIGGTFSYLSPSDYYVFGMKTIIV